MWLLMKMSFEGRIFGERLFRYLADGADEGRTIIPFHVTSRYAITYNDLLLMEGCDYHIGTDLTLNFSLQKGDLIEVIKPVI